MPKSSQFVTLVKSQTLHSEALVTQCLQYHAADVSAFGGGQCFVLCFVVGRLRAADNNRINKLARKAGSVRGLKLDSLVEVSERQMLLRILSIMDDAFLSLHVFQHF